jgi:acyl-CoA thioesterase YciA
MELISSFICMTKDIGIHGNLFGGELMSAIDMAGAVFAAEVAKTPRIVTVKIFETVFLAPVKVGHVIKIYGEVESVGNTSVTLRLEAKKLDVRRGEEQLVCSTKAKFVKIDEDGKGLALYPSIIEKYKN